MISSNQQHQPYPAPKTTHRMGHNGCHLLSIPHDICRLFYILFLFIFVGIHTAPNDSLYTVCKITYFFFVSSKGSSPSLLALVPPTAALIPCCRSMQPDDDRSGPAIAYTRMRNGTNRPTVRPIIINRGQTRLVGPIRQNAIVWRCFR